MYFQNQIFQNRSAEDQVRNFFRDESIVDWNLIDRWNEPLVL